MMNIMTDVNNAASAQAGSAAAGPSSNNNASAGQPGTQGQDAVVSKAEHDELLSKMGGMGQELGEFRSFYESIAPLLEKLDADPQLVQAIMEQKIDKQLAQAALEGRVSINEAQAVSQANTEVRENLGTKQYEALSPDTIEKMVEQKAQDILKTLEDQADLKSFEEKTQKFIDSTPDFVEYAEQIDTWLDTHDVNDVEIAYYAVKGKLSEATATKTAEELQAERIKELMLNAGGGSIQNGRLPDGTALIDKLVGGSANPLNF